MAPAAKGPVADALKRAEKILADDHRLMTNGITSGSYCCS
jgi:hypothetical protein